VNNTIRLFRAIAVNGEVEEGMGESGTIRVREWDPELFHRSVAEREAEGYAAYAALLDTDQILPEMNPETGEVLHLRMVEMRRTAARG
jgi:hypothetical protein